MEGHPRRIYADTSVFGGVFDEGFAEASGALFERFRGGRDLLLLSELTLLELGQAPPRVQELVDFIPAANVERLSLTDAARQLADLYLAAGVVGRSMLVDAQHIAVATLHHAEILVSWNFRHIVNLQRIHGFNSVNLKEGYSLLEIRSPLEVLTYD